MSGRSTLLAWGNILVGFFCAGVGATVTANDGGVGLLVGFASLNAGALAYTLAEGVIEAIRSGKR